MIVAFTGHRPNKLGGYRVPNRTSRWICFLLEDILGGLRPDHAISGMALGVDQWAAVICCSLKIPWTAAIPFAGQELAWPPESQREYNSLLKKAEKTFFVCEPGYAAWKMQKRNEWMVDNCDLLIAVWDGSPGGTGNCVQYAKSRGREIHQITP